VVASLYGGIPNEGLALLRYRKFGTKLATGSIAIQCQNLPPTSDSLSRLLRRTRGCGISILILILTGQLWKWTKCLRKKY
jgi:hypothetical protein